MFHTIQHFVLMLDSTRCTVLEWRSCFILDSTCCTVLEWRYCFILDSTCCTVLEWRSCFILDSTCCTVLEWRSCFILDSICCTIISCIFCAMPDTISSSYWTTSPFPYRAFPVSQSHHLRPTRQQFQFNLDSLSCFIMNSIFCFTPEGIFRLNWAASPDSLWTYPHTIHHALLKLHQLIWYWYIIHKIVYNSPLSYIC